MFSGERQRKMIFRSSEIRPVHISIYKKLERTQFNKKRQPHFVKKNIYMCARAYILKNIL